MTETTSHLGCHLGHPLNTLLFAVYNVYNAPTDLSMAKQCETYGLEMFGAHGHASLAHAQA